MRATPSAERGMRPYGLTHQTRLNAAYTAPPPFAYCPARQQSIADGIPIALQPALLRAYSVTWGTTDKDNKTDDGG
ncbi:hypothetical protein [Actinomadura yumaensis]|uniref:Uncharacterized protein n=1 Tax=Actinomadura yumaensis TaxID=111807 RepID=A0ABW2CNM6_9ACTN